MDVFEALADPVRRAVLRRLAAGPARVVDLAAAHPISRPAISRHLRVLSSAGLVTAEDRGRERHYRLDVRPLQTLHDLIDDLEPPTRSTRPPIGEDALDALETEVRRTVRDRRRTTADPIDTTARTTDTTAGIPGAPARPGPTQEEIA